MTPMKIAYVVLGGIRPGSGPGKKILTQLRAWVDAGHEPHLTLVLNEHAGQWVDDLESLDLPSPETSKIAQVRTYITTTRVADLVYLRRPFWHPILVWLRWVRDKLVIELNGPPPYLKHPRWYMRLWDRVTFGWSERFAAAAVAVDPEIFSKYFARVCRHNHVVIPNGFDLSSVTPLSITNERRIVLICSNKSPHHGLERLKAIASLSPDWIFDIVGIEKPEKGSTPSNIIWHGRLQYDDYRPILERASVGLGSLAWRDFGRTWNSALKVREYLAHGLPVALTELDPDVPLAAEWSLFLDSDQSEAALAQALQEFAESWLGRRVDRSEILSIDIKSRESQRLIFFEAEKPVDRIC